MVQGKRLRKDSTHDSLALPHGKLHVPAFLPDATMGVVRSVDAADLEQCGVQAVVMNTFHLMQRPGSSTVQSLGGLHRMAGWRHPIMTDSGGFQAYSVVRQNKDRGSVTNGGITFRPEGSTRPFALTPEKTVQLQLAYGADIVVCLDDCTNVADPLDVQRASVQRTIEWARRGKREFEKLVAQKRYASSQRPLLFAVVQGGGEHALRAECAGELLTIGFDGYGFGGWPLDAQGNLLLDLLALTRELIPRDYPMHALGVGHPVSIVSCAQLGYALFDSALPTRDARSGRLYCFVRVDEGTDFAEAHGDWFAMLYISDLKHVKTNLPVDTTCDCRTCAHYSLGYLHHLFKLNDGLFQRLATIHNLRFMCRLAAKLRAEDSTLRSP